jgi:hypothetical protein
MRPLVPLALLPLAALACSKHHAPTCTAEPEIVVGAIAGPATEPAGWATSVQPLAYAGQVIDLGERTVGETVSFDVPPGTGSFSIVSQLSHGDPLATFSYASFALPNLVVPTDLKTPAGELFYDDMAAVPDDLTQALAVGLGAGDVQGAFTVPATAASLERVHREGQISPGLWSFTVNDWAYECTQITGCSGGNLTNRYQVQVLLDPSPARATGTLDVSVYLVSQEVTVANATTPTDPFAPRFQRFVSSLRSIYAKAGICLGKVILHDVPEWARVRYSTVTIGDGSASDELAQLSTLSAGTDEPGVHVFLVDALEDSSIYPGYVLLGIDGSIAGPSGVPGTIHSGAAVTIADLVAPGTLDGTQELAGNCSGALNMSCGADITAFIAAHEVGHWLGLYHTTERTGTELDPLSDTPTCECSQCAPAADRPYCSSGGAVVVPASCSSGLATCGGAENLMFWTISEKVTAALTPQQAEVMRRNPAVR